MVERVVQNRDHIWDLLKAFATNEVKAEDVRLRFDNFPTIDLVFDGPNFHSSLPIRAMEGLKAIQDEIYRIYALAVYNDETYALSRDERSELELFFAIREGSSGANAPNLPDVLNRILEKALEKMEPKHVIVVVGVIAAGWSATEISKKYIDSQQAIAEADSAARTEEARQNGETERLEIVKSLAAQIPAARKAIEIQDRTVETIAKSVRGPEKVVLPDNTEITETVAKELYPRNRRRKAEDIRMDGQYFVESFARHNDDEFRVSLRSIDNKQFTAIIGSGDQSALEQIALAGARHTSIDLKINAKDLEGFKKDIVIVGVGADSSEVAVAR